MAPIAHYLSRIRARMVEQDFPTGGCTRLTTERGRDSRADRFQFQPLDQPDRFHWLQGRWLTHDNAGLPAAPDAVHEFVDACLDPNFVRLAAVAQAFRWAGQPRSPNDTRAS